MDSWPNPLGLSVRLVAVRGSGKSAKQVQIKESEIARLPNIQQVISGQMKAGRKQMKMLGLLNKNR